MATKTLYLKDTAAAGSNHGSLQDGGTAPTTATSTTGWVAGTLAPTRYARQDFATERASSTLLTSPVEPNGGPNNTLGDCWRTENTLSGSFAAANWSVSVPVIGITRASSTTDGRLRLRVWQGTDPTGAGATEITTATLTTSLFANLANGAAQTLTVTSSLPAATLAGEYLFVQVAFELTGVGDNANADVHIRVGSTSTVTTADFTAVAALSGVSTTGTNSAGTLAAGVMLVGGSVTTSAGSGALMSVTPKTWGDATARWGDWAATWVGTPRQPDYSANVTGGTGTLTLVLALQTGTGWPASLWPDIWPAESPTFSGGLGTLTSPPLALAGTSTTITAGSGSTASPIEGTSVTASDGDGTLTLVGPLEAPDAILAATNLTGNVSMVQDDPSDPAAEWLAAADPLAATDLRVSFPTPVASPGPGGPTKMRVLVRRTTDPSAPNPNVILDLWEGGTFKATLGTFAVSSTSGQVVEATINPADLTDPTGAGIELRVRGVPV